MTGDREMSRARESPISTAAEAATERVARLQLITAALTAALTPQQAIGVIVEQGIGTMQASAGFLSLVADDGRHLDMVGATGYDDALVRRWPRTLLTAATPTADAVLSGEAIWLESPAALAASYPELAARPSLTGSRAFAALPLRAADRSLGALGLSFDRPHPFSDADRAFMLALAQQCALALARSRLYQAEQLARGAAELAQTRLTVLAGASSALAVSLDYEATLRTAARQLIPALADWCAIDLAEGTAAPRRAIIARNTPARPRVVRTLRCSHLLDEESARAVTPVLGGGPALIAPRIDPRVAEPLATSAADRARLLRLPSVSRMIVPLALHRRVVGAITLVAGASGRVYDDADLTLAEDLARRIALALDNSSLYQAMREAEQRSRRQAIRAQGLAEAAQEIAAAGLDLEALLRAITSRVVGTLGDGCIVCQLSGERRELLPLAIHHDDPAREARIRRALADAPLRIEETLHGQVATNREALALAFAGEAAGIARAAERTEVELRLGTHLLIVPLRHGETSGTLSIIRDARGPAFDEDERLYAQDLADRAALALDNNALHRQLARSENHLRDLVGRLITSQEEERRRVAYEVHDGLAQVAVAAHQHLQAFARQHYPESPEGRAALERAMALAQQAVDEARRVIADLRPTVLDDFGLASALEQQVGALRQAGWEITYSEGIGAARLPTPVETALFRVAQEALNNVRKHAQTTIARVALERDRGLVRLVIQDWGRGFERDAESPQSGPGERVGLPGMRERITLVGGSCRIETSPGAGTRVVAEVPL